MAMNIYYKIRWCTCYSKIVFVLSIISYTMFLFLLQKKGFLAKEWLVFLNCSWIKQFLIIEKGVELVLRKMIRHGSKQVVMIKGKILVIKWVGVSTHALRWMYAFLVVLNESILAPKDGLDMLLISKLLISCISAVSNIGRCH